MVSLAGLVAAAGVIGAAAKLPEPLEPDPELSSPESPPPESSGRIPGLGCGGRVISIVRVVTASWAAVVSLTVLVLIAILQLAIEARGRLRGEAALARSPRPAPMKRPPRR